MCSSRKLVGEILNKNDPHRNKRQRNKWAKLQASRAEIWQILYTFNYKYELFVKRKILSTKVIIVICLSFIVQGQLSDHHLGDLALVKEDRTKQWQHHQG